MLLFTTTFLKVNQNFLVNLVFISSVSLSIITPFYSASLVETVQSDIASEKPGILDVFREGTVRLLSWGSPNKGRMLPVWSLVIPTTTLGLAKYVCGLIVSGASFRIIQARQRQRQEKQVSVIVKI